MGERVVSFGVQKLLELLSRESERLYGIDKQVSELERKLKSLESFLKDANEKKHESERVRNYLEDVQEIVYDAEDVIESFILKESRGEEHGIGRLFCFLVDLFKRVKILACFLMDRRSFASDIEDITKRISEVIEGLESSGIQKIIYGGVRSMSLQERQNEQREARQTFSNNCESDLVGVENSVEELVGLLVENDNNFQVVSITGMGGIGKTTLARQVFHHDIVRRHFDGFAWVCVSQEFTRKHIWKSILQDLKHEDISLMDEDTLQRKVFQLLETSSTLIVLDDVWKNKDWDRIKAVFQLKKGWKMLLTSRNEGVGLHADPACFPFRPRLLSHEESWTLCERIVFPRRDNIEFRANEELEALGKQLVRHCGGLPLAVKVLGGLLATKRSFDVWKRVSDNIGAHIIRGTSSGIVDDNNPNSVTRVLSMSYEDLPMQLKHCFLYLAYFPKDHDINMESLFSCWAAEGMIVPDGSTIQETGEAYMEGLVRRNMVILRRKDANSSSQSFQMHGMMREVCISKAKEDNFLQVVKVPTSTSIINSQSLSRFRRLAVHSGTAFQMMGYQSNSKVRALICFTLGINFWIKSGQVFQSLPLLRVLDLSLVKFKGGMLPTSIGELIHLRFLSLYHAVVSHLPPSLGNLKLLLYLNLGVSWRHRVNVPNVLKKMLDLRCLTLPQSMDDDTKLELSGLVNMESLKRFSTKHSSVKDLTCMTKLRTLGVDLNDEVTTETLSSSLCGLRNLEKLSISGSVDHKGKFVMDFTYLKDLELSMRMKRLQLQFLPLLSHIRLSFCSMKEDPMPILEKMLHLKSVDLSYDAFSGRRMACSKDGFPQLCALEIKGQENLEEWTVEETSMPCLQILTLDHCKKLKELPHGLKFITSLKELKIERMKEEWTKKLVPYGEDYYKVQHIPSVQFFESSE